MDKLFEIKSDFNEVFTEDSNIFLNVCECNNIKYSVKNCNCNIFVFINSSSEINEVIEIINSKVEFYYIELNGSNIKFKSSINIYKNSDVNINTILYAAFIKNITFDITNVEDHSSCEIYNNVIGIDKADYTLKVIGNILKKSPYSKCIQKTHSITIGNPDKMLILPVLNIDNENVIAAHSLSSGTIDEKIMYYLNARGISTDDAIKLIINSYLSLPDNIFELFEFANIKELYKRKVDSLCLI